LRVGSGLSTLASGANVSRGLNITDGIVQAAGGANVSNGLEVAGKGVNITAALEVVSTNAYTGLDIKYGGTGLAFAIRDDANRTIFSIQGWNTTNNGTEQSDKGRGNVTIFGAVQAANFTANTGVFIVGGSLNASSLVPGQVAGGWLVLRGLNISNGGLNVTTGDVTTAGTGQTVVASDGGLRVVNGGLNISGSGLIVSAGDVNVTAAASKLNANLSLRAFNRDHLDGGQNRTDSLNGKANLTYGGLVLFMNTSFNPCATVCSFHGLPCATQLNLTGATAGAVYGNRSTAIPAPCSEQGIDSLTPQLCICGG